MKKTNYTQDDLNKEIKKELLNSTTEKYLVTKDEILKDKRTSILDKIILFYQNDYVPVIKKHNDLMIEWNEINMELFMRGCIKKEDVVNSNQLLKNKLEKLF